MRYEFLVLSLFLFGASSPSLEKERWIVDSSSELVIRGATNVNSYVCRTDCYSARDTLEFTPYKEDCEVLFSKNAMLIPISGFDCGNILVTNDFRETLHAKKHPNLSIQLISLGDRYAVVPGGAVAGRVEISLAGATKAYNVMYNVRGGNGSSFTLLGNQTVCFSDFNLQAPKKMMGLIRVEEYLEVEFIIHLSRL